MPSKSSPRPALCAVALALTAALLAPPSQAQERLALVGPKVNNSTLDAPLFYQLLIGELELNKGDPGTAYQVLLDAARRTKDEALYRRAVEVALSARAGDRALAAARAWRDDVPGSLDALRYIIQLQIVLNKAAETAEPLKALIAAPPDADRVERITTMLGLLGRDTDRKLILKLTEQALARWLESPNERVAANTTLGRAALGAGDEARAIDLARKAQGFEPGAEAPALLALELLPTRPEAETLVQRYLATPTARSPIRLVYARVLAALQRYGDATTQFELVTQADPNLGAAWLSLGALYVELHDNARADVALKRYLALAEANPSGSAAAASPGDNITVTVTGGDEDDADATNLLGASGAGVAQAQLMLAQMAEQRQDYREAEEWLNKISSPQRVLEVQGRRASLLARQGRLDDARALIRDTPETAIVTPRAKVFAEAQLLRDQKQWATAAQVLQEASVQFPNDPDLIYEQSMMAEKLNRLDEMEALLRRVIELKPDHHHAYNALGYSLADRNLRLTEARSLIARALELSPGDPFITDSMGWAEFRLGRRSEALRLLREAYRARPDVEIAAHLGEVLWVDGNLDEARRVWGEARARDASNEVLRETLVRLRVEL